MKILRGTVFGGITFFVLGWLIYGLLLMDFMSANSDTSIMRPESEMIWWAMILSNLIMALVVTLILNWSGASKPVDAIKIGALIGFLICLGIDFSMYSMTTMYNMTAIIVDAIVTTIMVGITGAVIVLTWGKSTPAE